MAGTSPESDILICEDLTKEFRYGPREKIKALDAVTLRVARGEVTGLIGPDGAGKTTFIRLATGLFTPEAGSISVLGIDVATDPQGVQSRVGYMPQRFGLYEDLTVEENLNLYADLHGIGADARAERYPNLMQMTGLGPFQRRLAGQLSGGMKQKLGLACTLLSTPDLLLLDEPTVGVDPLSRRELWEIVYRLVREQGLTVLLSTSYLDEAERCDTAVLLLRGKVLEAGPPSEISSIAKGRTFRIDTPQSLKPRQLQANLANRGGVVDATLEGNHVRVVLSADVGPESGLFKGMSVSPVAPRFEDGFMTLVQAVGAVEAVGPGLEPPVVSVVSPAAPEGSGQPGRRSHRPAAEGGGEPGRRSHRLVVEVHDLTRKFGSFIAVNNVTFRVHSGEIFGLLGPNGAGKSTTFRMLCGLLPASGGTLSVAGMDLRFARASARQRIGYVAQKFSLYGQLTVMENLDFFSGAYGLRGPGKRERIDWALEQFDLRSRSGLPSGELPAGYKQRLAMACALMHQPEILFLDEPTSGVDPLARREFWQRIGALADEGVTVIVTTHFMEEAEYCDRMVIMVDGRVLAEGTPADIRRHSRPAPGKEPAMEDAFIAIVEDYRATQET